MRCTLEPCLAEIWTRQRFGVWQAATVVTEASHKFHRLSIPDQRISNRCSLILTGYLSPSATDSLWRIWRRHFALTYLFFVAADAHNQSYCKLFSVVNEKQMKITSFSNCFEQQSTARPFASVSSSADVSLNTSNQECCRKQSIQQKTVLFGVLSDKLVAGLIGLVSAHLPRSHSLHCMCT